MAELPGQSFAWDRLFPRDRMATLLRRLGLHQPLVAILLNYIGFVLAILLMWPYIVLGPLSRLSGSARVILRVQRIFGWIWLACFGVYRRSWYHPELRGDGKYVFTAEHMCLIDIPLYASTWPTRTSALSAREYAKVPMYGWVLKAADTEFIERRNKRTAVRDLRRLDRRIRDEGISVLVVPSGTRSPHGDPPPFRRGVFSLVALGRPIVPLYLIGLERLTLGKYLCRPGRVDVVYGEPITPEKHPQAFTSAEALRAFTEERMREEGAWLRSHREALMRGELLPARRPRLA